MKRQRIAGIVAIATVLLLAGCSSAAIEDPEPTAATTATEAAATSDVTTPSATPKPTATPTPTAEPKPEGTVDGRWCPTPESSSPECVTVKLPTVVFDSGVTETIKGEGHDNGDGGLTYIYEGAPFGTFYPAGTPIDLPDYYSGADLVDQDRIWNGQTSVMFVRAEPVVAEGFPDELQGTWCAKDITQCFSLTGLLAENPAAFLYSETPSEQVPGTTDYVICLAANAGAGECTTSATMYLRSFPTGVAWDCSKEGREGKLPFDLTTCDPDYSAQHDPGEPRLIVLPNHQQAEAYLDSKPLYLVEQ